VVEDLIQRKGWPFGDCKTRLQIKVREWHQNSKGGSGAHSARQNDYRKRKGPDAVPIPPKAKPDPVQRGLANAVERLEKLTLEEQEWRTSILAQCVPSPEPPPVEIPLGAFGKKTATTFQKEFKKAHMRAWSALTELPKVFCFSFC
jgi:hypothetical protein